MITEKPQDSTEMEDQKSSADWLPAGWTTEVKVRKDGRQDKYYTDPVSGYVFRSMKDIRRYLKTGELGRLAIKPKDKGSSSMELEDDKISSLELVEAAKDEQNLESTCTGDCKPHSEHTSGREGAAVSSVNLPEAKDLEQREGNGDATTSVSVSPHVIGTVTEKLPLRDGVKRHGNGKTRVRLNAKKVPDLPRRASKRLAGIEVDPALELKTSYPARRVAARRSAEAEASTAENFRNLATPEEHAGKVDTENKADEKKGCPLVSPQGDLSTPEEHAGQIETNNEADEKPGSPLDLPLRDSWMDPCIDFAVKTLTGVIPIGDENKADENPGSRGDMWKDPCFEFAIKTLTGATTIEDENKALEIPGSPLDSSFGDLWTDPCIEFAVKTLTGAIPVGDDLGVQNYLQQQCSPSETKGPNGMTLSTVGLDFCHTDLLCQQSEKPLFRQQELVLPQTGNVRSQNSGDGSLHQPVEREK
uniref:MBD domain-containing protein n=1 Tax=Davidia involucrata TaxID=16924 RepID=A0A5B6YMT6_DAVIN